MPPINTVEDAVNTAERFLSRYHSTRVLEKVVKEDDKWVVEFDVGILGKNIVRVTLDAQTGAVIGFAKEATVGL